MSWNDGEDKETEVSTETTETTEETEDSQVTTTEESVSGAETSDADSEKTETEAAPKTLLGEADKEPTEDAKDKPEGSQDGDGSKEATSEAEPAPIKYEDFTAPEGVEISEADMTRAKDAFAEARLPQDQAQKYLDLHLSEVQRRVDELQKHQFDQWMETRKGWQNAFKADEEIGGNRTETTLKAGKSLIAKYGEPGLIDALNDTGVGDHPEFIRFLARLSEAHQETSKAVEAETPMTVEERAARRYKSSSGAQG